MPDDVTRSLVGVRGMPHAPPHSPAAEDKYRYMPGSIETMDAMGPKSMAHCRKYYIGRRIAAEAGEPLLTDYLLLEYG